MQAYCYILRCADGSLYSGWTKDIAKRLKTHNAGKGAKYTRCRLPVQLVYLEQLADEQAARQREVQLKKLSRRDKLALAAQYAGEGQND